MTQESSRMVIRTALIPKELDIELRNNLDLVPGSPKSVGDALQCIVYAALDRLRERERLPKVQVNQTQLLVLRTIRVTDVRSNELKKYAFQRSQGRHELIVDMISSEVARRLESAAPSQHSCVD